jgi:hypothetical protein
MYIEKEDLEYLVEESYEKPNSKMIKMPMMAHANIGDKVCFLSYGQDTFKVMLLDDILDETKKIKETLDNKKIDDYNLAIIKSQLKNIYASIVKVSTVNDELMINIGILSDISRSSYYYFRNIYGELMMYLSLDALKKSYEQHTYKR